MITMGISTHFLKSFCIFCLVCFVVILNVYCNYNLAVELICTVHTGLCLQTGHFIKGSIFSFLYHIAY